MSRSHRKTPAAGITTSPSDKAYKQAEHRRERRRLKELDLTETDPPSPKAYGDPWSGDKDGKLRFDPQRYPEGMRK